MKLDDLEALAKAATPGPWVVAENGEDVCFNECIVCEWAGIDAPFIAAANPTTILEMVNLIRMMKKELEWMDTHSQSGWMITDDAIEALAAVKRWEKGESE